MSERQTDREWPPFKPDLRLIRLLEKGRSEEEVRAILEEPDDPATDEDGAPEKPN